ncbi:hypothetical protein Salat_0872800 [Sesamum alatum]|uniref:Uncharacterized protein n=1 Tax=Sesamum alatum TaxID=300844 RepID=A0AAE1YJG1_9LAMI|nr:hypothetical protein Salat_0872800 [Sesamum alatum]
MFLSPNSLVNPNSEGNGATASVDEDEPVGTEESLQTLEHLKARWASRYGGGASGSMLTSVGTLVTASFSGGQSITCGSTSSPRVLHGGDFNLTPPAVLLQPESSRKGVPLSPSVEQDNEWWKSPSMQPPILVVQSPIYVGSIVAQEWRHIVKGVPRYAVCQKLKRLKPVFVALKRRKGDLLLNSSQAAEFLRHAQTLVQDFPAVRPFMTWRLSIELCWIRRRVRNTRCFDSVLN